MERSYIMAKLSNARDKVYGVIKEYIIEKGYSPSIREICQITGYKSTSSVHNHIQTLIREGRVIVKEGMEPGTPRTLCLHGYHYIGDMEYETLKRKEEERAENIAIKLLEHTDMNEKEIAEICGLKHLKVSELTKNFENEGVKGE